MITSQTRQDFSEQLLAAGEEDKARNLFSFEILACEYYKGIGVSAGIS